MINRYRLNRAGLFGFWLYDDEIIDMSDGRLLLRGANGSGKTVTMQSLIPLVLDGNKRPERLDPFGSQDRRIEFYLLGDGTTGYSDRTGYLYLEFHDRERDKYLTVGIGIRVKHGDKQVGFWGFAITDNRRIGIDLFLYDSHAHQLGETVPLQREQLASLLGRGGSVVKGVGEYAKLVNDLLFGFDDIGAYEDLLTLLIRLRSPKLSKEFKPTTIYGILQDSLAPLRDDELRPLADTVEDMDEISSKIYELKINEGHMHRLDKVYRDYNELRLFNLASEVLQVHTDLISARKDALDQESSITSLKEELEHGKSALQDANRELSGAEFQVRTLREHDALKNQGELLYIGGELQSIDKQIVGCRQRLSKHESRRSQAKKDLTNHLADATRLSQETATLLSALEQLAGDCEYKGHHTFHLSVQQGQVHQNTWIAWRKNLALHDADLLEATKLGQAEQDALSEKSRRESDLSAAKERRDEQENLQRTAEQKQGEELTRYEENISCWRQNLTAIDISQEDFTSLIHTLRGSYESSNNEVQAVVSGIFERQRRVLKDQQRDLDHEVKELRKEKQSLQEEISDARQREPAPLRTDSRTASRQKRIEAGEAGAPLYALCEFRPNIAPALQAALETTLASANILDVWVTPVEKPMLSADDEIWIRASPALFAHTISDYLTPSPDIADASLREVVDNILRTIKLSEALICEPELILLNEQGAFKVGPLYGKAQSKPRAEFIGKKSREETKRLHIESLEHKIELLTSSIVLSQQYLDKVKYHLSTLEEEHQSFPQSDALRNANNVFYKAQLAVQNALEEEQIRLRYFEAQVTIHSQAKASFIFYVQKWTSLRSLSELRRSQQTVNLYITSLSELQSQHLQLSHSKANADTCEEQLQNALGDITDAEEEMKALEEQHFTLRQKYEALQATLKGTNVILLQQQLLSREQDVKRLKDRIEKLEKEVRETEIKHARADENLNHVRQDLSQKEQAHAVSLQSMRIELELRLLPEWLEEACEPIKSCKRIRDTFRRGFENVHLQDIANKLTGVFAEVHNALPDYVLELSFVDNRIFIHSSRGRRAPATPSALLAEVQAACKEQEMLLSQKDRELFERVILGNLSKVLREKIHRAEKWIATMNTLMDDRQTSSGINLYLKWDPHGATNEQELDSDKLVQLLKRDAATLTESEKSSIITHFRSRIAHAKQGVSQGDSSYIKRISEILDYRQWYEFSLHYKMGSGQRKALTDRQFNRLSGGEKAMAMYIPLFAAVYSRYSDARPNCPKIISLDEAFAGVDDENVRDLFKLLTDMDFDYIMTSQVLWGCYDTVPALSIVGLHRPQDSDVLALMRYYWNGHTLQEVPHAT